MTFFDRKWRIPVAKLSTAHLTPNTIGALLSPESALSAHVQCYELKKGLLIGVPQVDLATIEAIRKLGHGELAHLLNVADREELDWVWFDADAAVHPDFAVWLETA